MNKLLLTFVFGLCVMGALMAQQQYAIQFSYDAAGNQTLRNRVCVNCQGAAREPLDTTEVVTVDLEEDILQDALGEETVEDPRIMAYPNPVTNILHVEWVNTEKPVAQMVLFSGIGRQLYQTDISTRQGNLNLDFSTYPPGRYILYVQYTDRSKKAFHILKK